MPAHWTYDEFAEDEDLEQGDILQPTDQLRLVFAEAHPHFLADKYIGFLVATQSCDLVLRHEKPKAPYINVAVIRPLRSVTHKLIAQIIKPVSPGYYLKSDKPRARDLLNKIFNQNEQAAGVFFLNKDADSGIAEESVALLRITVALKSDHYDILRKARAGRLNAEFRAKLGWLLGNLYARPATRDWSERDGGKIALERLVSQFSDEQVQGFGPNWVDDELVRVATENGLDLAAMSNDELEQLRPKPRHEFALDEVKNELTKIAPELDIELVNKLINRLRNNRKYRKLFT